MQRTPNETKLEHELTALNSETLKSRGRVPGDHADPGRGLRPRRERREEPRSLHTGSGARKPRPAAAAAAAGRRPNQPGELTDRALHREVASGALSRASQGRSISSR